MLQALHDLRGFEGHAEHTVSRFSTILIWSVNSYYGVIECQFWMTDRGGTVRLSVISRHIRKPDQVIQPWQFDHSETKTRCLNAAAHWAHHTRAVFLNEGSSESHPYGSRHRQNVFQIH
ncbi:gp35, hypothetical protein [Burkholderia phage phi644-2]|uniref:Uncharacterized protein n=2 Tax=root TaxID=1 RepID=A4JX30_9CAUD|nr:hypothetical protein [Burkholderia pseudomallei]YP_001111114.1 gp35, hypothetical protein [Burkholderia phage phi644-2]ABO60834.1 gp35, hypothetical protein [Burkholderia phage phi644-2]